MVKIRFLHLVLFIIFEITLFPKNLSAQINDFQKVKKQQYEVFLDSREDLNIRYDNIQKCKRKNRWKRNFKCRKRIKNLEEELNRKLSETKDNGCLRSSIFYKLYQISSYFNRPNLSLLYGSSNSYRKGIKFFKLPDIENWYPYPRQIYLREVVMEMEQFVAKKYTKEYLKIKDKHPPNGMDCLLNNGTQKAFYHNLAILMIKHGYYEMALEVLHFGGITVKANGNTNLYDNKREILFQQCLEKMIGSSEYNELKANALLDIHIQRGKFRTFGYCFLGSYLIHINLGYSHSELSEMGDKELIIRAIEILKSSPFYQKR